MDNKRGLSDVVTVALVLLLSIAAVMIVWSFVLPMLQGIGDDVKVPCFNIDVKAVSCDATGNTVTVSYGSGTNVTVNSVKLQFYNSAGNPVRTTTPTTGCTNLSPLDITQCNVADDIQAGEKVAAAFVIGTKSCEATQQPVACA